MNCPNHGQSYGIRINGELRCATCGARDVEESLERVVAELADPMKWNWGEMMSQRDAADCVLAVLAREGLIERGEHPYGGKIWRVGERLFGRTDGITNKRFEAIKRPTDQDQRPLAAKGDL